jgi:hypothetical protein
MPHGRSEDWVLLEFRDKLAEADGGANKDEMWAEFRQRVEKTLDKQAVPVDVGMDRGI